MANVFAPNGFNVVGSIDGVTPNGAMRAYPIGSTTGTVTTVGTAPISHGDIVVLTNGTLAPATAASTGILGVFVGCEYQAAALNNQSRWSQNWPGGAATAAANTIPVGYVVDDPSTLMIVQSGTGGPVTQAMVGTKINLNVGTANPSTGISGMYADFATQGTGTASTQFIIAGLTQNNNANGGDNTTAGNMIYVTFAAPLFSA